MTRFARWPNAAACDFHPYPMGVAGSCGVVGPVGDADLEHSIIFQARLCLETR